jgi:hypothetical protein
VTFPHAAAGQGQPSAPAAALPLQYFVLAPLLSGRYIAPLKQNRFLFAFCGTNAILTNFFFRWILFGEQGKIVTVSKQRIAALQLTQLGFTATVVLVKGERVTMLVAAVGGALFEVRRRGCSCACGSCLLKAESMQVVYARAGAVQHRTGRPCTCLLHPLLPNRLHVHPHLTSLSCGQCCVLLRRKSRGQLPLLLIV